MAKTFLDLRSITGLIGGDVEMNMATPGSFAPGQVVIQHAATGLAVFAVVQNRTTSTMTVGQVLSKLGTNGVIAGANVTAGAVDGFTSSGFTANYSIGAIAFFAAPAGVPSGEYGIITVNTATVVTTDARLKYSAAPGTTHDVEVIHTYQSQLLQDNAQSHSMNGVIVAEAGIATLNFGLAQIGGLCPKVKMDDGELLSDESIGVVAGSTAGEGFTTAANEPSSYLVGIAICTTTDTTSDFVPLMVSMGQWTQQFTLAHTDATT